MWTGVSIMMLLAGIGAMVWWYSAQQKEEEHGPLPEVDPLGKWKSTASQIGTLKYFCVVAALILVQMIMGIITAHYGVEGNGFYGIGILNNANEFNIGTLWRSAYILVASFMFTVTKKYKPQSSDVTKAWTKIPLYHYETIGELKHNLPHSTKLIGVEMVKQSIPLIQFQHPIRGVYLL